MTSFSGWGPVDDGRIKPDIVAKGYNVYSTNSTGDAAYTTMSGTSMATPTVTGLLFF
jgi:subtilisin family serine protease